MQLSERRLEKLTAILEVAKAMTEERDLDRLLMLIVNEATKVVDTERSSLFLYDRDRDELWSKIARGAQEIRFSAKTGVAGTVARTGEISNIADAYADPHFNRQFDLQTGFVTRSILTVPMKNSRGEIIGVLQTLNKHGVDGTPAAFTDEDIDLLLALAGVAAASITNALLNEEIAKLFEGFAKAAVVAIESRDPNDGRSFGACRPGHGPPRGSAHAGDTWSLDQHHLYTRSDAGDSATRPSSTTSARSAFESMCS